MATKVTFDDAEEFMDRIVVDEATITGDKLKLTLNDPEFWGIEGLLRSVNWDDQFELVNIDFEKRQLTIQVNK